MQGKERELTYGMNRVNFGARTYNPTIGRFDKVDRFAEKYSGLSTYQYAANNPVNFIDINGDSLDISGIQGSNAHGIAFRQFAKSKDGKKYLANYAAKGQVLKVGSEEVFTSTVDGKYHKKGVNLKYTIGTKKNISNEASEITESGNLNLTIELAKEGFGSNNTLFNLTKSIAHESFLHAETDALDFIDDAKLNKSVLTQGYSKYGNHADHYHYSQQALYNPQKNSLWPNAAERILNQTSSDLGLGINPNQVKRIIWSFSGSLVNVKSNKISRK